MEKIKSILVIILLVLPFRLFAQEVVCEEKKLDPKYQPKIMFEGEFCALSGSDYRRCYTFEQYKELLKLDNELNNSRSKVKQLEFIKKDKDKIIEQQKMIIITLKADKDILEDKAERLEKNWNKCLQESEKSGWRHIALGIGSGLIVGITSGILIFTILKF